MASPILQPPAAPELQNYPGEYDKYARDYRLYLELLNEYRSRGGEEPRPVSQTVVRFAPQVQRISSPPPPYVTAFQDGSSDEGETRRRSLRRLGVSRDGRRATSPASSVAANSSVSVNSDRVKRLASGSQTANAKPDDRQIVQALSDVCESDLIDWLRTNRRAPKTFRSLNNLREQALRRNSETGHRLMRKQSWAIVSRG
jgi:hypothetical protein